MADASASFALGSAEAPRSLLWRAWTRDDEFHLAASRGADTIELTAYPTGRWRIETGGEIGRWHRPTQAMPGWTRGPAVVLRGWDASAAPMPKAADPVTWLAPPAEGQVVRIQVWFAIPGAEERRWRQTLPKSAQTVMALSLRRAGSIRLVRDDEPAPEDDRANAEGIVTISTDQAGLPSFWEIPG